MTDEDIKRFEKYLRRDLYRPNTNIFKAVLYLAALGSSAAVFTGIVCALKGIIFFSFENGLAVQAGYTWSDVAHIYVICAIIVFCAVLRLTLIGIVHLYQHYAPEAMRRRCFCMPSCSEYMILAIRKYGPILGTCKGIKRLVSTCDGECYKIDYP